MKRNFKKSALALALCFSISGFAFASPESESLLKKLDKLSTKQLKHGPLRENGSGHWTVHLNTKRSFFDIENFSEIDDRELLTQRIIESEEPDIVGYTATRGIDFSSALLNGKSPVEITLSNYLEALHFTPTKTRESNNRNKTLELFTKLLKAYLSTPSKDSARNPAQNQTIVAMAVQSENITILEAFAEQGADFNQRLGDDNQTPLLSLLKKYNSTKKNETKNTLITLLDYYLQTLPTASEIVDIDKVISEVVQSDIRIINKFIAKQTDFFSPHESKVSPFESVLQNYLDTGSIEKVETLYQAALEDESLADSASYQMAQYAIKYSRNSLYKLVIEHHPDTYTTYAAELAAEFNKKSLTTDNFSQFSSLLELAGTEKMAETGITKIAGLADFALQATSQHDMNTLTKLNALQVDFTAKSDENQSPLLEALIKYNEASDDRYWKMAELMLNQVKSYSGIPDEKTVLLQLYRTKEIELIQDAVNKGADFSKPLNDHGQNALTMVISEKFDRELIQFFYQQNPSTNSAESIALAAIGAGDNETLDWIFSQTPELMDSSRVVMIQKALNLKSAGMLEKLMPLFKTKDFFELYSKIKPLFNMQRDLSEQARAHFQSKLDELSVAQLIELSETVARKRGSSIELLNLLSARLERNENEVVPAINLNHQICTSPYNAELMATINRLAKASESVTADAEKMLLCAQPYGGNYRTIPSGLVYLIEHYYPNHVDELSPETATKLLNWALSFALNYTETNEALVLMPGTEFLVQHGATLEEKYDVEDTDFTDHRLENRVALARYMLPFLTASEQARQIKSIVEQGDVDMIAAFTMSPGFPEVMSTVSPSLTEQGQQHYSLEEYVALGDSPSQQELDPFVSQAVLAASCHYTPTVKGAETFDLATGYCASIQADSCQNEECESDAKARQTKLQQCLTGQNEHEFCQQMNKLLPEEAKKQLNP
ncbi:hypothetical protein EOPP23_13860 [Endozoicomonas sp. OPT23]|uniref:hypothetical protein n=1 Tax=Endozoicomonas sp. OPT23 TaxID=2072845 RepID=UPI00129AAA19|nr:hypothetical protein [Endozoicomonas sp. OPT23]MRI34076.1 hypothetical protein [Endozoicomonas sp. OPT23]